MGLSATDLRLIAAIQDGLPLDPRPYARIAEATGLSEPEVIARLGRLAETGVIRRFGVVVHHHELGYRANAMVVWDVPDDEVREAGRKLAELSFVSLCYRRPRRLPDWPCNLYCMIHGRDRGAVEKLVGAASAAAGLNGRPRHVLFSRRRFKQRGARYARTAPKLQEVG
jgi:DNA-binding Lrp family transcriptional regulator